MADRRSLRKLNQLKNQPAPIPKKDEKGGLASRDPNTGKRSTDLDNGGTYQAEELFSSSVNQSTQLQLNPRTKTADYESSELDKKRLDSGLIQSKPKLATGIPSPEIEDEDDGGNNPDNPFFGNCAVCNGKSSTSLNCVSGSATVNFSDGSIERIKSPAVIEYSARVKFNYSGGGSGSLTVNSCGIPEIAEDKEDDSDPFDPAVYGSIIFARKATSVNLGGSSGSDLKEFQIYQKNCNTTIVGVKDEGQRIVLGYSTCNALEGSYTDSSKTCITIGVRKACGIDPNSLEYECVTQGFRLCRKYRVSWVSESTGEELYLESCDPIGYAISQEPEEPYSVGARSSGGGILAYDSGIPRSFLVNGSLSSGEYGYFQIYQDAGDSCAVEVVGVKLTGDRGAFSGAVLNKEYSTIWSGGCSFDVLLGAFLQDSFLRIHNHEGAIVFETGDFVESSIVGCQYTGGKGDATKFSGNCRSGSVERVSVFEKAVDSSVVGGADVSSIACDN